MVKKTSKKGKMLTKKEMKKTQGGGIVWGGIEPDAPGFYPDVPDHRVRLADNPKFVPNAPEGP